MAVLRLQQALNRHCSEALGIRPQAFRQTAHPSRQQALPLLQPITISNENHLTAAGAGVAGSPEDVLVSPQAKAQVLATLHYHMTERTAGLRYNPPEYP